MLLIVSVLFIAAIYAKPCCLPEVWEGLAAGYDAQKNVSFVEAISFDTKFEAFRVDFFTDFRTNNQFHHTSIFLLRDRKDHQLKYYVYDRKSDSCTVRTDNKPFPKLCVHENHKREHKFTIGLGYPVVFYGYDKADRRSDVVVSEHQCVPITGTFFDHHKWEARIDYWDVKLGVGNPIVFELPKACEK